MKKQQSALKTNVIYGLIVVVPLAVLALLLIQLVDLLEELGEPLGLESSLSTGVAVIMVLVLLLLVCFVVGALVRTRLGSWSFARLERIILKQIPGYEVIGSILKGFAEKERSHSAVLVQLFGPGTAVFGFVMEEHGNDRLTVFVPSAPAVTMGSVHVVERDRVTLLDASAVDVTSCLSQWGIGAHRVLS